MTPQLVRGGLAWTGGFSVDGDGSPRCYAADDAGLSPLDDLICAGHPGKWWGIATNILGEPIVQGANDPCPGYYVSMTALVNHARADVDPLRYVDAEKVPYVSVPPEAIRQGVRMGDVAWVCHGPLACGAIVADEGPGGKWGEGSIALADALGIMSSPKHGGVRDGVSYVVFPGSRQGWPRDIDGVQEQARQLFETWSAVT